MPVRPPLGQPNRETYHAQAVRGRWSSADSVLHLLWSVSAVAGGFLLDRFPFAAVALTSAGLQVH